MMKSSIEELLKSVPGVDESQRQLWLRIYQNAASDRERAIELYDDVIMHIKDDHTAHAIIGGQAAKYLERLNQANAQFLKLAELVQTALGKSEDAQMSSDELFDKIKKTIDEDGTAVGKRQESRKKQQ